MPKYLKQIQINVTAMPSVETSKFQVCSFSRNYLFTKTEWGEGGAEGGRNDKPNDLILKLKNKLIEDFSSLKI